MRTNFLIAITFGILLGASCTSKSEKKEAVADGNHKVTVTEVIQTSGYTYLNVSEEGKIFWIAVPRMDATMGDELYYTNFMEMNQFASKELNRVFESVLFVSDISKDPIAKVAPVMGKSMGKPSLAKKAVTVEPVSGGITISELFANKEKYSGKKITIKGQVVKVNKGIMDKNWFHIQDGTESNGSFDLTITSTEEDVEVGDQLVFVGTAVLDKDFGAGYAYDVILESAEVLR
jgi:starvation-inducible outer membrane lipoprotein